MKYLITTCEVYRADSLEQAEQLINEAKKNVKFTLSKYTNELKEVKSKGEIVDSFYKVTLTKTFNDIKEPDYPFYVDYFIKKEDAEGL